MMTDGQPQTPRPPADEEDAALWSLLERAKRPRPVSPYFARRVLREVAASEKASPTADGESPGWLARLWRPWQGQARGVFAGALSAVALLAVGVKVAPMRWNTPVVLSTTTAPTPVTATHAEADSVETEALADNAAASPSATAAEPAVAAQDVEVIADLDNLLSNEESRLWTDEDTTARF